MGFFRWLTKMCVKFQTMVEIGELHRASGENGRDDDFRVPHLVFALVELLIAWRRQPLRPDIAPVRFIPGPEIHCSAAYCPLFSSSNSTRSIYFLTYFRLVAKPHARAHLARRTSSWSLVVSFLVSVAIPGLFELPSPQSLHNLITHPQAVHMSS